MKIELVITVWENGLFRLRDRIEADDTDSLKTQFALSVMNIEEKLSKPKYVDDDIPF
jgi:CII-binding regulator of phage lambda lysogenization HflD